MAKVPFAKLNITEEEEELKTSLLLKQQKVVRDNFQAFSTDTNLQRHYFYPSFYREISAVGSAPPRALCLCGFKQPLRLKGSSYYIDNPKRHVFSHEVRIRNFI